jgi:hypothetical protein
MIQPIDITKDDGIHDGMTIHDDTTYAISSCHFGRSKSQFGQGVLSQMTQ